jgi:hypothetical protein
MLVSTVTHRELRLPRLLPITLSSRPRTGAYRLRRQGVPDLACRSRPPIIVEVDMNSRSDPAARYRSSAP